MATANDLIKRAMRLCNALPVGQVISAEDAADALLILNNLLAEWYEAEIGLPDYSFTGLTDTLATDAADFEGIAGQLAIRLAPEYGQSLFPDAMTIANDAFARLRLRYFQPGNVNWDELPNDRQFASYSAFLSGR